eukprot:CAMPEP_0115045582 /NCGR_PEP_ID=MMETSP0216-20121206/48232_1 /TAXON_ID=223996 /ORGANISM="Protocruzia adherens, Strain Boccale" /LENGTH=264 /DNA_ID=CAMNT_0002428485 /DNA_START=26 /DNA_END=815 /DNA_ORIENTATION=-
MANQLRIEDPSDCVIEDEHLTALTARNVPSKCSKGLLSEAKGNVLDVVDTQSFNLSQKATTSLIKMNAVQLIDQAHREHGSETDTTDIEDDADMECDDIDERPLRKTGPKDKESSVKDSIVVIDHIEDKVEAREQGVYSPRWGIPGSSSPDRGRYEDNRVGDSFPLNISRASAEILAHGESNNFPRIEKSTYRQEGALSMSKTEHDSSSITDKYRAFHDMSKIKLLLNTDVNLSYYEMFARSRNESPVGRSPLYQGEQMTLFDV